MAVDSGEGNQYFDYLLTLSGHKYDKMGCRYLGLNTFEDGSWTIEYTLRDSDGFYAALLSKPGIEKDWVTFGITESSSCRDAGYRTRKPVFPLQRTKIKQVKQHLSKIVEENEKKLILEILSIILIVIPFVNVADDALFGGVAMISRIAALVDIVGSTGLTAYDIVKDPTSAPFTILGLLIGGSGTGVRSEKEAFGEAVKARRGLSVSDVAKFADEFVDKEKKIQQVVNGCLRV
ncbi:hypothetical protein ColLi_07483 [Colletotrichum liriopes]|uniref:Uncharacterized protein n=1 Tax=Colletotrichum liriopes TaxID=708192 RepID=A0AA37GPX1_9PEZI|nr:hypothetical protein ColLi_07483 [Colletotrichum liriopes]